MPFDRDRVREDYLLVIDEMRSRLPDDQIEHALNQYVTGPWSRDKLMDRLNIDYVGTVYELIAVYQIQRPPPDPVEDARQAEMIRLVLRGETVPMELRVPASWR